MARSSQRIALLVACGFVSVQHAHASLQSQDSDVRTAVECQFTVEQPRMLAVNPLTTTPSTKRTEPIQQAGLLRPIDLAAVQPEPVAEPANEIAGPDISEPGPDSADLPDSAFAVPPGVAYLETSLTYTSSKGPRVRDYFTATLLRIGLWEDFELRVASPGLIHENGPNESTTGFGPLTIGFKQHIWDEIEECGIPAFGIIAQVTAPTASAGFDDGTAVPTIFFNFDHTLPCDSYFEWNAGLTGAHDDAGDRFLQGSFLWSLGHEWNDSFTTFFHGLTNFPSGTGGNAEVLTGPGAIWFLSKQCALDFSYNFGLTDESDHRLVRLGLSIAF